jgi:SAM-dependent methyltransferase
MCSAGVTRFAQRVLSPADIADLAVLEVGAMDINGSLRPFLSSLVPKSYLGVDIRPGPSVDEVCDAGALVARYGERAFDIVATTEMLEHVQHWRAAVSNMKRVLKPNGVLLLTTRSEGFPYHGFPHDFWRFSVDDARVIFGDLTIETLEADPSKPGIFLKARRPVDFAERPLDDIELLSMIKGRRIRDVSEFDAALFNVKYQAREAARKARRVVRQQLSR